MLLVRVCIFLFTGRSLEEQMNTLKARLKHLEQDDIYVNAKLNELDATQVKTAKQTSEGME